MFLMIPMTNLRKFKIIIEKRFWWCQRHNWDRQTLRQTDRLTRPRVDRHVSLKILDWLFLSGQIRCLFLPQKNWFKIRVIKIDSSILKSSKIEIIKLNVIKFNVIKIVVNDWARNRNKVAWYQNLVSSSK